MPWTVERGHGCPADKPWAVVQADGTRMGCHATEDDAKAQQAALYAKEGHRMSAEAPPSPTDGQQTQQPAWMGRLRWRAVVLDDIEIMSRAKGGDGRTVVAYAAVFDREAEIHDQDGHYRERIAPTAFDKTLAERAGRIGVYYNHAKTLYGTPSERWSVPLGVPVEMRADSRGLLTVTRYDPTPDADQILAGIKSGSIRGMSFTGAFLRSDPRGPYYARSDGALTVVTRQEIAMSEYGPTPIPAYEDDDAIVGVRSQAVQEQERIEVKETAAEQQQDQQGTTAADADTPAAEGTGAAEGTEATSTEGTTEPPAHSEAAAASNTPASAPTPPSRRSAVEQTSLTAQERAVRQSEIRSRMNEIDAQFNGATLPEDTQTEWNSLSTEFDEHERAILADTQRKQRLRAIVEQDTNQNGGDGERVDPDLAGYGQSRTAPTTIRRPENIFDLAEIRNRARSIDELPVLYRDYAMRAVEQTRFPSATGQRGAPSREQAQERIAALLDTIDDEHGTLARRILVTGSPLYERAFGKMLARQSISGLTVEESRALSLGTDSAGGYAVPFQLDPTVILSSSGVVNPLRAISRVETITGKEWDGVTSAGVTVSRGTEAQEVGTGDPAFVQPTVRTTRVQGWVPFSIELDVTWNALRTQLTNLLQDAKDIEEATAFATGNGTAPNPSGVVSTLGTASWVDTAGSAALAAADIYLLENAMAPRFIANSRVVAAKTTFNRFRTLFQAQASSAGDPFARPSGAMGETFNGYPKHELSTMASGIGTGSLVMLQGDFNQFLIVDRVGMGIELIPHVLGANRRPTGERGVFALWFNNSKILVDNAFRLLRIKST
jgi:HK97 family phage major capsid protein/HK97 family phage prohead protease